MGTYTTNYNLFMPTVGETGWGTLVNGNFSTIDTTMKSLSNRITAVESEVNGALSCTSVTTSGTITSTGLITGNGGFKGDLTGNVTGKFTGTRTLVTSEPYTNGNIVFELPSFSAIYTTEVSSTFTIPSTITTPYGSFSATRPTLSVSYTATTATVASNVTLTVKLNGTTVWSKNLKDSGGTATVTFNLNTSISNTISVVSTSTLGVSFTPNHDIYLK